jgi:hypothetical protein
MKTQYEISLNHNDLFKAESLSQVLNNLEMLDFITEDVFLRINKNILEKKNKLENLKSRITRCSNIINLLETLPQALTIKSKRSYPLVHKDELESLVKSVNEANYILDDAKVNSLNESNGNDTVNLPLFTKSIYYDDIYDFNLAKTKAKKNEINSKPYNLPVKLGKKPDGSLEDVTLTQEILNSQIDFKEIKSDLNISKSAGSLFNAYEIPPEIENINSIHQFLNKAKVFGEKSNLVSEIRDSNLLNVFMNKNKGKEKTKTKKIQEAPTTISEKHKMTRFKQKKELIRRNTSANVEFNIPMNLNLPLISEFDVMTNPLDDYYADEKIIDSNEMYAPQGTIFGDDVNEFQTPLDIIKNYKNKQSNTFNNIPVTGNTNVPNVGNNSNTSNNSNTNSQATNSNTNSNVVTNTNSNMTNTSNQINNAGLSNPNPNSNSTNNMPNSNIGNINNSAGGNPETSQTKQTNSGGTNNAAKKLKPPPLPKIKPKVKKVEEKKKPEAIPISVNNETDDKTKSDPQSKPEPIIPSKAPAVRQMSMQEEIQQSMARLKQNNLIPPEQLKEKKPAQASMVRIFNDQLDLLRKEINLRYDNLNRDNEPTQSKKKKKKRKESDSFSSESGSD